MYTFISVKIFMGFRLHIFGWTLLFIDCTNFYGFLRFISCIGTKPRFKLKIL